MTTSTDLLNRFEEQRPRLRAVAFRLLGSLPDADDALQDAWLRVAGTSPADGSDGPVTDDEAREITNVDGWLTTVVTRVCLNALRSRRTRREDPFEVHVPEPIVEPASGQDPEHEAVLADHVGLALLVVLETLGPAERLAFVLHDMFAVPFDEIATMLDRSPEAVRQLASRARRRVQQRPTEPDPDLRAQRQVVDAFFAAARGGDLDGLMAILHPDVVLTSDGGRARPAMSMVLRGPAEVTSQAVIAAASMPQLPYPALVNGAAGVVVAPQSTAQFVMAFTVVDGRIVAIDVLADPERLEGIDVEALRG
ncbi:sigma-70 family RNA polymerase sigma factor [Luteimicrobium sp. NPDC057192]|uniref:sigma-70 family RNA polymerase sigma factor n=1 Tax=Luteimicrobium sp. NPDC057192 TaxID=3346042 RepID=UPI00364054CB